MPLTTLGKQQIFKGKFLKVWSTIFLDKSGKERQWEWVEKRDFVIIFPITNNNKIVLLKHYRVPLEQYVVQLPAGLLDKPGETREDAARRELLEETGYRAEKLIALPPTPPSAGMSNQMAYPFIATGLTKISDATGDATEDISIMEIPADDLFGFYKQDHGADIFSLNTLAFYFVAKELGLVK